MTASEFGGGAGKGRIAAAADRDAAVSLSGIGIFPDVIQRSAGFRGKNIFYFQDYK